MGVDLLIVSRFSGIFHENETMRPNYFISIVYFKTGGRGGGTPSGSATALVGLLVRLYDYRVLVRSSDLVMLCPHSIRLLTTSARASTKLVQDRTNKNTRDSVLRLLGYISVLA